MTWLASAARTPVADVAGRLGIEVRRAASSAHCRCPACGAERRHAGRRDRRGAVGIPLARPHNWHCHACEAAGDAVDFASHALHRARFRDLSAGERAEVRAWFDGSGITVATIRRPAPPPPPAYPHLDELAALWDACMPVSDSRLTSDYLAFRGISVQVAADLDLARALPSAAEVPYWAGFERRDAAGNVIGHRTWAQTRHQLIVPLYDARGVMRNVLARSIDREPWLKSTAALGYARTGLVMADSLGRGMLEHGRAPRWWGAEPFVVTVYEGEIDGLVGATSGPHGAVLSVVSGSWTPAVAARIPVGAHVTIATDDDAAGDRYAAAISATLEGRCTWERRR